MSDAFVSGKPDGPRPSDCLVRYQPKPRGQLKIQVESKVDVLFGRSIKELTEQTLTELGITHGLLEIDDDGALPFVLQARIEAAVKDRARELGVEVAFFQSNHEGAIVDFLQESSEDADGIVINPAALTGVGYSLGDALRDAGLVSLMESNHG